MLGQGVSHNLLPLPSPYAAQLCTTTPPSWPLEGMEDQAPPRTPTLTRADTPHLLSQDRGDSYHFGLEKCHPCATLPRQDSTARQWQQLRWTTVQIRPHGMGVWPHPPRDGAHEYGLDLRGQPSQQRPWPQSLGSWPPTPRPWSGYLPSYDALGRPGNDDEGHGKITSHRTADEPPPC
jgi:hypothetical protein